MIVGPAAMPHSFIPVSTSETERPELNIRSVLCEADRSKRIHRGALQEMMHKLTSASHSFPS